jgi:hypothetical protein
MTTPDPYAAHNTRTVGDAFVLWRCVPTPATASSFTRFLDHTQRRTTVGRAPLDEWSAWRRYLYLTTHNSTDRHQFEPAIPVRERLQTDALDRAACDSLHLRHWGQLAHEDILTFKRTFRLFTEPSLDKYKFIYGKYGNCNITNLKRVVSHLITAFVSVYIQH